MNQELEKPDGKQIDCIVVPTKKAGWSLIVNLKPDTFNPRTKLCASRPTIGDFYGFERILELFSLRFDRIDSDTDLVTDYLRRRPSAIREADEILSASRTSVNIS